MHILHLELGYLITILIIIGIYLIIDVLFHAEIARKTRLVRSFCKGCIIFFCIELSWVTSLWIPPLNNENTVNSLNRGATDWVTERQVRLMDLGIPTLLMTIIVMVYLVIVRRSPSNNKAETETQKPVETNTPSLFFTIVIAIVVTCFSYILIIIPLYWEKKITFMEKVLYRGPIPYFTVLLFVWSAISLILMTKNLLNNQIHARRIIQLIKQAKIEEAIQHHPVSSISHQLSKIQILKKIGASATITQWHEILESYQQEERQQFEESLIYMQAVMWAIPVLGFLGTVVGIGMSVEKLIPLLRGLSITELGGAQVANALDGLGIAFDTTIVALLLVLPVTMIMVIIERLAYEDIRKRTDMIMKNLPKLIDL